MKSIIKVILISLIIVAILGYAENRTSKNTSLNIPYDKNNTFLVLNQSTWSNQQQYYSFNTPDAIEKFRIQSIKGNYSNATIIINISHIRYISFDNDKMIIRTFD